MTYVMYGEEEFADVFNASVICKVQTPFMSHYKWLAENIEAYQYLNVLSRVQPMVPATTEIALVCLRLPVRT